MVWCSCNSNEIDLVNGFITINKTLLIRLDSISLISIIDENVDNWYIKIQGVGLSDRIQLKNKDNDEVQRMFDKLKDWMFGEKI